MKVLVIGGGGREHAIAWKLAQSPLKPELIFAPGNPGMAQLGTCFPIKADDITGLLALAQKEKVGLTVVGPEIPLVMGVVDAFEAEGMKIFGPNKLASQLEGSKAFSKAFMERWKIPTATYRSFKKYGEARGYLIDQGAPIVVKASGLAAGKGAVVCLTLHEAIAALDSMLGPKAEFGEAGNEVVIEEFMDGEEASLFVLTDGTDYVFLPTAQDHKRAFDGDNGPNTGGMGAYTPAPIMTQAMLIRSAREIVEPTLKGMTAEGNPYRGILYVGLMITPQGPKVVEYNCRLGDPETQAVMAVLEEDLLELVLAATEKRLKGVSVEKPKRAGCVVVMASGGYPGSYKKGSPISGIDAAKSITGVEVMHAGTRMLDGDLVTDGGRVLGVVGEGEDLQQAIDRAYEAVSKIHFEGQQFRKDIGQKGLAH